MPALPPQAALKYWAPMSFWLQSDAVKACLDRVTNPENKLKRFSLFSVVAKTEAVDDYTARITLKKPFSAMRRACPAAAASRAAA